MIFAALCACIFWSSFNFTAPLMAGTYIASELGASTDLSSYDITFFGLGNACVFPIARIIESRIGKIEGLFFCVLLFTISILCTSVSPNFPFFVTFRFICGVFSGVFFSFSLNLINTLPKPLGQKHTDAFLGFLISLTPTLGACFGGWISYEYNWKWIFLLQMPFLAVTLFMIHKFRSSLQEPITNIPFDKPGYLLYLLSVCPLVVGVCLGQEMDWFRSSLICCLLGTSLVFFPLFILWSLKSKHPLIDFSLFRIPAFAVGILSIFVLYSTYLGMVILLSSWLHLDVNYTPLWIAFLMLHMLIAGILLFVFIIKWMEKTHPFLPVLFAIIAFAISAFYSSYFNTQINFERIAISRIFAGFGLAFFFFPLLMISLKSVPTEKKEQSGAIFQSCRVLGGSLGVAFYTTVWLRRTVFYHERLGSSLTDYSELTNQVFTQLGFFHEKGLAAKELLNQALDKQATALGLADTFYLMGWLVTGLFIIVFICSAKSIASYYKQRLWAQKQRNL